MLLNIITILVIGLILYIKIANLYEDYKNKQKGKRLQIVSLVIIILVVIIGGYFALNYEDFNVY